ncbi:MAG: acetylornithine deacetylase [Sulfitobacter sp.]
MTADTKSRLTPLEILRKLVAFPTVSSETNLPLIDWVEEYLNNHGINAHRYVDSEQQNKAALFAQVGPPVAGAIVLSGHTDVVPVEGQDWHSDPFELVEKDDKYYGRGTCDMKGFDALAIWALVEAHHAGIKRPLQIALSFDEEIGCTGAPPMIEAMQSALPKGSAVVVGEPSGMRTVTGHKGTIGFGTKLVGFEVHSSLMHVGVSAIMYGAKLIDWANVKNQENAASQPGDLAALFVPPYTTLHVGKISGGTADNITAKTCEFAMDLRVAPGEQTDDWRQAYLAKVREVEAEMQAVVPDTRIEISPRFDVPALRPEKNGEAEALARSITGDNDSHVVSYGTEAGQFQDAGYSAVVCGPGSVDQAHQANEYISVAQFEAGHKFMRNLITHLGSDF